MNSTLVPKTGCPLTRTDLYGRLGAASHLVAKYATRNIPAKFAPEIWQAHTTNQEQLEQAYALASNANAAYGVISLAEFREAVGLAGKLRQVILANLAPTDTARSTLAPFLSGTLKRERLADVIDALRAYIQDHAATVTLGAYLSSVPWDTLVTKLRSYDPTVKEAKVKAEHAARDRATTACHNAWVDLQQFVAWSVMEFEPEEVASRQEFRALTAVVRNPRTPSESATTTAPAAAAAPATAETQPTAV